MSGFIQGTDRHQATLFPERLDDYIPEDNAVRVIDVFLDELDLSGLGFKTHSEETGRPAYHPTTLLKIYVYGYLNRVQSSRLCWACPPLPPPLEASQSHRIGHVLRQTPGGGGRTGPARRRRRLQ